MNNKEIKARIINSIAIAEGKGFTLINGEWGSEVRKCACPISCVLVAEGKRITEFAGDLAQLFSVSENWIISFVDGFDGNGTSMMAHDSDAWKLGEEIRHSTKAINYEDYILGEPNE